MSKPSCHTCLHGAPGDVALCAHPAPATLEVSARIPLTVEASGRNKGWFRKPALLSRGYFDQAWLESCTGFEVKIHEP